MRNISYNGDFMKRFLDIAILFCLLLVLLCGNQVFSTCKEALLLWFEKLVPSLFISMVLIRILYQRNVFRIFSRTWLARIFHMDREGIPILLCAMLLGFPAGASFIDKLCANGVLDQKGAKRYIQTCCYATSGFVIMTCGVVIFQSATIGYLLFLSQIIAGLILFYCGKDTYIHVYENHSYHNTSIMKQITKAITESGISLYMIGGYLLLFMSLASLLFSILPASLNLPIRIIAEFSSGVFLIQQLPYSPVICAVITCMLLGFGGFCVHMQIFSMSEHVSLSYMSFLIMRILQAVLSSLIFYFLFVIYLSIPL